MTRAWLATALWAVLLGPCGAHADDLGGAGFALPPMPSWNDAQPRLLVQLRAVGAPHAPDALFREDIPETRTILVLTPKDGEAMARDVTADQAAGWGQEPDRLFERAIANLERRFPPQVHQTPELRRGVRVTLLYGDHPYAAGYALSIAKRARCLGRAGALVAIPSQHAMLCYPIQSSRAYHGYLALVTLAVDIEERGDDPIVPHVYWYHAGAWETQPVTVEGKRFDHERSPGFSKLLKDLPRDIHDPRPRRW